MPLEQRVIEPIYPSQGVTDGRKNVYDLLPNELECFSNETLANVIRQLASLSQMAEDLFGSIAIETQQLLGRTGNLQQRVHHLNERVQRLDSSQEHVSLHELHMRRPYKAIDCTQQAVFGKKTLPLSLQHLYDQCDQPPKLDALDPYRDDNKKSLKFYTDPDFFFELWRDAMLRQVDKERTQKKVSQRPDKKPRAPANSTERFRRLASQHEFLVDASNQFSHTSQLQGSPQLLHHPQQTHPLKTIPPSAHAQVSPALYSAAHIAQHEVQFYDQYDTVRRRPNMQLQQQPPNGPLDNGVYGNYSPSNGYTLQNGIYGTASSSPHTYSANELINNGMARPSIRQFNAPVNGPSTHSNSHLGHNSLSVSTASMQTLSRRSNSAIRPSQPPPAPPLPHTATNGHSDHSSNSLQNEHLPNQSATTNSATISQAHHHLNLQHHQQQHLPQQQNQQHLHNGSHLKTNGIGSSINGHPNGANVANHLRVQTGSDMIDKANNDLLTAPTQASGPIPVKSNVPAPPPPPPPPPMLPNGNGSNLQLNGDRKLQESTDDDEPPSNGVGLSNLAQEILKKQKQLQPVKLGMRPAPKSDPRNDLLAAIREGIKLRRVEDSKQKEVEKSDLVDVASILARRVAMQLSESESDDASESSDCWEDDAEC